MSSLPDLDKLSYAELEKLIIKIVYARLKPLGFRKHGKTLHRFVDGDISQTVYFVSKINNPYLPDMFWINIGIRVPECDLWRFVIPEQTQKYYHFATSHLRGSLFIDKSGDGTCIYFQKTDPQQLIDTVMERLENEIIPAFDVLSNRDNIINHKEEEEASCFHLHHKHLIRIYDSMILGRRGNLDEAAKLFKSHYQDSLAEYNDQYENGYQKYLLKGDTIHYKNQKTQKNETIIATHDGYYTIFGANRGHVDYLEKLAKELGIDLNE